MIRADRRSLIREAASSGSGSSRSSEPTFRRWGAFNAVGVLGFGVQLAVLAALKELLGLDYLAATGLAVEVSILHNFLWHERWTWADRATREAKQSLDRLVRFHGSTAILSIVGNLVLTGLLVERAGLHYLLANALAVAACSILTFLASDRLVFTDLGVAFLVTAIAAGPTEATLEAWSEYVRRTEERIAAELGSSEGFLSLDFQRRERARRDLGALLDGEVLIAEAETRDDHDRPIDVPDGAVHHWRGAVFIPGVDVERVLQRVAHPDDSAAQQEDVLASRVLDRGEGWLRVYLRLRREGIISVTYDTEHLVRYRRHGDRRASSRSEAVRIVEVVDAGTPEESVGPPGRDRGFLWRMNSYWRYRETDGGVLVECESLTLSRSIPALVRLVAEPLIERAARSSMERTLASMRDRLTALVS